MNTTIATISQLTAADIYRVDAMDTILAIVTSEAEKQLYDASTAGGRQDIVSLAAKISKTKIHLDRVGKDLVAEWKNKSKLVDHDRKKARDTLDALRDKIRMPVTEYENREKNRIEEIVARIDRIKILRYSGDPEISIAPPLAEQLINLNNDLQHVNSIVIDDSFNEFFEEATLAKNTTIEKIKLHIIELKKVEKEAEEIKIKKIREQEEREKQIAETARQEEKIKVAAELKRAEDEKIELQKTLERQQREAKTFLDAQLAAAEAKAKSDAQRIKEDRERKELEKTERALLRSANLENQRNCNNDAFTAFTVGGLDAVSAKLAVELIAKHKIPYVVINY